jgi:hypothetical protein
MKDIYLTRSQVAERLMLSVETVKWHKHNGTMPEPDTYIENKPLWKESTIERWNAGRRKWNTHRHDDAEVVES